MNKRFKSPFGVLAQIILMSIFTLIALVVPKARGADALFSPHAEDVVYFVPQFSEFKTISSLDMYFLKKILRRAEERNVKAVIFELDTPGGSVEIALKYVSVFARSKVPVIAYLNPQGISAGMIIALAADRIAINPNGVIGDAMPVQMGPGGVKPIADRPDNPDKQPPTADDAKEKKQETSDDDKSGKGDKKQVDEKEKPPPSDKRTLERILEEIRKMGTSPSQPGNTDEEQRLAKQKFLTVFFKVLQVLAEKNHRPVRVIRAMADPYQKLTLEQDGIVHGKVSPLTLSASEAIKLKVVDYVAADRENLLVQLGLQHCKLQEIKKSSVEQIISFLAHPMLAGLLIIFGLVGIYIEIKTPGFGVPGLLGLTALTLFFLGHVGSGASEWGPIVIFFVGMVLIGLELFVIPGFGIVGVLGLGCVIISFFAAFGLDNLETASQVIGLSMLAAIVIIILLTVYVLPKSSLFRRVRLATQQLSADGYSSHKDADLELLHARGVAHTPLRPVGIAFIGDKRLEVTTEGDYIETGHPVEVVEVTKSKVVVKKIKEA